MHKTVSDFKEKILLLGLDGLSPKIIEPMMAAGQLPHFCRLKEKGAYRSLATTNPSQSPVAWSGFATGQNPGKNGVYDFIVRNPQDYMLTLSLSYIQKGVPQRVIKSKTFWNYTSERGVPAVIIGCPVTFPPDPIHGKMLSGMGVPDILGTEGTFTFYTTEKPHKELREGGKVFYLQKSGEFIVDLIGPRLKRPQGRGANATVPVKIVLSQGDGKIRIDYQGRRVDLTKGEWSDWQEVTFSLGPFKTAKGIFKFYLVDIAPEFKLYVSPINFDPRAPLFSISSPAGYSRELARKIGLYHTQGMPMDTWAVNEKRLDEQAFLVQVNEVLREKIAMLDFELARLKQGLLYCYFESSDIIQHMFWRYTDPGHPLYEQGASGEYKEIIER
jgi:hypothetical protein